MTALDKERLLNLLSESHHANLNSLEGVNLHLPVHPDSNWQVRDIFWHLSVWDREVTKSIRAFSVKDEYSIPALDEHSFNERAFQEGQEFSSEQVVERYKITREDFINSIDELPVELFNSDLLYPWGDERGDITKLVKYMVEHDVEHRQEVILAAGK